MCKVHAKSNLYTSILHAVKLRIPLFAILAPKVLFHRFGFAFFDTNVSSELRTSLNGIVI